MNAKEMFEKLGYEKQYWFANTINFVKKGAPYYGTFYEHNEYHIMFITTDKTVKTWADFESDDSVVNCQLSASEIVAIHQQMKKLGWIE